MNHHLQIVQSSQNVFKHTRDMSVVHKVAVDVKHRYYKYL